MKEQRIQEPHVLHCPTGLPLNAKLTVVSHPQTNPRPLRKLHTRRLLVPRGDAQPIRHLIRARETIHEPRPRLVGIRLKGGTPDQRPGCRTVRPGHVDAVRRPAEGAVHGEDLDGRGGSGGGDRRAGGEEGGERAAPAASGDVEFDEHVFLVGAAGLLRDAEAGEVGGYWVRFRDAGDVRGDGGAAGGAGEGVDEREEGDEGGDRCEEAHGVACCFENV